MSKLVFRQWHLNVAVLKQIDIYVAFKNNADTMCTYFQGAVTLQISRNENYTMFMFTAKRFF